MISISYDHYVAVCQIYVQLQGWDSERRQVVRLDYQHAPQ